jgi:hypothetical protein
MRPRPQTAQELQRFYEGVADPTKLDEYHANEEGYVQAQQDAGVISADTAELILLRADVIKETLEPPGGEVIARVVFPP